MRRRDRSIDKQVVGDRDKERETASKFLCRILMLSLKAFSRPLIQSRHGCIQATRAAAHSRWPTRADGHHTSANGVPVPASVFQQGSLLVANQLDVWSSQGEQAFGFVLVTWPLQQPTAATLMSADERPLK